MLSDLHIHSTYSDGKKAIPKLAEQARQDRYDVIGITDHLGKSRELDIHLGYFPGYIGFIKRENRGGLIVLKGIEIGINDKDILGKLGSRIQQLDYLLFEHAEDRVEALDDLSRQLRKPIGLAHPNFSEIPWRKIGSVFVELNTVNLLYADERIDWKNFPDCWLSVGSDCHYVLNTPRVQAFHDIIKMHNLKHVLDREDFQEILEQIRSR